MKRFRIVLSALLAVVYFGGIPIMAQHNPGPRGAGTSHHGPRGNAPSAKSAERTVSDKLTDNTKLASKCQALLPAGTNLQTAASGFKNLGQFVAAVHVSHNLGIPFDQLKAKMLDPGGSLGKAIHALDPNVSAKAEAKKATKQAHEDIKEASS